MSFTDPIGDMIARIRNGQMRSHAKVEKIRGLDITIVTHGTNKDHNLALLEKFNFPFNKENKN